MPMLAESAADRTQVLSNLQSWIGRLRPDLGTVSPGTDIIEERVIDSLQFMNFISYVEELRGASIKADEIEMNHFRTLSSVVEKFF
jgi:acyl carrier protein